MKGIEIIRGIKEQFAILKNFKTNFRKQQTALRADENSVIVCERINMKRANLQNKILQWHLLSASALKNI